MWARRVAAVVMTTGLALAACSSGDEVDIGDFGSPTVVDEFSSDEETGSDADSGDDESQGADATVPVTTIPVDVELPGTSWLITAIDDEPVVVEDGSLLDPSLTFDADQVSGFDGCNSFGGAIRIDSSGFEMVEPVRSTLVACEAFTVVPVQDVLRDGARFTVLIQANEVTITRSDGRSIEGVHFESTSVNR